MNIKYKLIALSIGLVLLPFGLLFLIPSKKHAICIGIDYKDAILSNDAILMKNTLKGSYTVTLLINDNATKQNVIDNISELKDEEYVLIFISVKGSHNTLKFDLSMLESELSVFLNELKGETVLIVNSCKSGSFIDMNCSNITIITSCSASEPTYYIGNWNVSIFVHYFSEKFPRESLREAYDYAYGKCVEPEIPVLPTHPEYRSYSND